MTTSNAKIIKALTDAGLRDEVPLTPEQEDIFKRATNSEESFFYDVEQLFTNNSL